MELSVFEKGLVVVQILTICCALTVNSKRHNGNISELKAFFKKEIETIQQKCDTAMSDNEALRTDISQLKLELEKERNENAKEIIMRLQAYLQSKQNELTSEINDLKTQLSTERKEKLIEINHIKDELLKTRNDMELDISHCKNKLGITSSDVLSKVLSSENILTQSDGDYLLEKNGTDYFDSETNNNEIKRVGKARTKLQGIKTQEDKKRQTNLATGSRVAFFARLTNNTPVLSPNQDIVYDNVVTNLGRGYHNAHGTFIAPVPGVYVFTTSILAFGTTSHHAKLVKNGQLLAKVDFNDADSYDHSSQTVIVELDKGDDIAVQNADYTGMVYHGYFYSTFSGFLLYEYDIISEVVGK